MNNQELSIYDPNVIVKFECYAIYTDGTRQLYETYEAGEHGTFNHSPLPQFSGCTDVTYPSDGRIFQKWENVEIDRYRC